MKWIDRLTRPRGEGGADPLYAAIIAEARQPHWYRDGAVPDTIDGRFDMVAAVLALVLLRLERDPVAAGASVAVTERFIADMDAQLRELGIGDIVVGKHIGKMMSMLGGRLGAYREARDPDALEEALVRNVYRGVTPAPEQLTHVRAAFVQLADRLNEAPLDDILAGRLA